jgi:hypothetical protein
MALRQDTLPIYYVSSEIDRWQNRSRRWTQDHPAAERAMKPRRDMLAYNSFILAMAHWQKGDKDEAPKWFEKAVAWTEEKAPKNDTLRGFWNEAAELLGQPGPDAVSQSSPATPAVNKPR